MSGRAAKSFTALSARYDRGDGYIIIPERQRGPVDVPASYEQWSIGVRGDAALNAATELQARANLFHDERLRGLPGTESLSEGGDASVRLVGRGGLPFEALAYIQARHFTSGFASANTARTVATPTLDQYGTPASGLGAKVELRPRISDAHELQLGFDARRASGETRERFRFQGGDFTRLRKAGGITTIIGVYAEDSWRLSNALTLTGGVRLDQWRIVSGRLEERDRSTNSVTLSIEPSDRAGWEPTARAGFLFELSPAVKLRSAAYLGWRLPTLNELYRPFRVGLDATGANAELDVERLRGVEAGIDFAPPSRVRASATLFWNKLEDAIGNVTISRGPGAFPGVGFVAAGGAFRQRQNLDAVRSRGVEVWGSFSYGDFTLSASYALTDAQVKASGAGAVLNGLRPAQTPRHRASSTIAYGAVGSRSGQVTIRYLGRQFEDDLQSRRQDEALTLDAVATLPLGNNRLFSVRGENLLDAEVESGISEAGIVDRGTPRTVWADLRLKLN
jgi:outer membrane receptor protein involved in Fe transport